LRAAEAHLKLEASRADLSAMNGRLKLAAAVALLAYLGGAAALFWPRA
jgi:hypothetical protein